MFVPTTQTHARQSRLATPLAPNVTIPRMSLIINAFQRVFSRSVMIVLAALGVAAHAWGQTAKLSSLDKPSNKPDLSFLPKEQQRMFSNKKLDELDLQILRNKTAGPELHRIMSNSDWKKMDPNVKRRVADGGEHPRFSAMCGEYVIYFGDVLIQENAGNLMFAPTRLSPQSVWGWAERPKQTEDYVTLTSPQLEGLPDTDKAFATRLLFIINDYVHTFRTWPDKVPDITLFRDGSMNAKTVETGGSIFRDEETTPWRWMGFTAKPYDKKTDAPRIHFLENRQIPEDMDKTELLNLYDKLGYIFRLSDFEGYNIGSGFPGTLHNGKNPIIAKGGGSGIRIMVFTNGVLPVRGVPGNASQTFADIQKKERVAAEEGLRTTLKALTRDRELTTGQREIAALVLNQFNAAMSKKTQKIPT